MTFSKSLGAIVILFVLSARSMPAQQPAAELRPGVVTDLGGRKLVLTKLDSLPYVESEYSKRFRFDSHDNPKLKEFRERFKLDEVVAPGKDEFGRQVLLLDWVNNQIKKFGRPDSSARGALAILQANDEGKTFFCAHYADVLVSAAASLGWVDRSLTLRRPDNMGEGATEHSSTEIWSNQHRKWVMFDPTFAMYVEKDGVPLSAYELRQEWFYHDGKDLVFVIGKERKKYRKADLPIFRKRFPGYGDLSVNASGALNVYAFIGYVPNTNLMDAGPDYGKMFITQDKLGEGTKWHTRIVPANPAADPYFPINQASLRLVPEGDHLSVAIQTLTPNFKTFLVRIDGGEWKPSGAVIAWRQHVGANRLEAKAINQFGVEGPVSAAEVSFVADGPKESWVNTPQEKITGVEHKTFASAALKSDVGYNIYLPPDYASSPDKTYPVVYYLPGMGDTESTHLINIKVLDEAIKAKQLPPLIYVHTFTGKTSWFTDAPAAGIMAETLIIKELIPHVDVTYRTIAAGEGRAIQGFSMGGYGALKFAFKHPELFSSVTAYAAGLLDGQQMQKRQPALLKSLFSDDPKVFDEQSPPALVKKNLEQIRGKLAIRVVVGDKDFLLEHNRKIHALLDERKLPHEYEEITGVGHNPQQVYQKAGVAGWQFNVRSRP